MFRQHSRAKSSQEEVVSPYDNILIYTYPVRLYNILHQRSLSNPSFLPRCLSYKIRAKAEKKSAGTVVFNFKDRNNTLQKTEVTENCSCPFCYMRCGSFKGLQLHLNSFHDLFEFEFRISEEQQTVNVSVRLYASGSEEEGNHQETFGPYSFCSKPRKRRQRGGSNNAERQKVTVVPMDSPSLVNDTEKGIPLLNDENHGLGYTEATDVGGQFGMNNSPAIAQSSLDSDAKAMLTSEAVVPAAKRRKLSAERSEARSVLADGHIPWAREAFSKLHKKALLSCSPLFWCWRLFMVKLKNMGLVDAATINNSSVILENCDDNSDNNNNNNNSDPNSDNSNNNNNSVDHRIDTNSEPMDVVEDANNSKDK